MARLVITDGFLDDISEASGGVQKQVWSKLALIQDVPDVGSRIYGTSLKRNYGSCLKLSVAGFHIIYRRESAETDYDETIFILGLVNQRRIR